MLQKGQIAPDFSIEPIGMRLHELRQKAVLFFYPGDFTGVCTKEACYFRDHTAEFTRLGARLFGISKDDSASHERFQSAYQLNYELVADPDQAVARAYHVLRGIPFLPPRRLTFVLDAEARIIEIIQADLDYRKHVERALQVLSA